MSPSERIYGVSSLQEGTRSDDKIDDALIAWSWREETEPTARRALRYDTSALAAFGWGYVDRFREWSRHRGSEAARQ